MQLVRWIPALAEVRSRHSAADDRAGRRGYVVVTRLRARPLGGGYMISIKGVV